MLLAEAEAKLEENTQQFLAIDKANKNVDFYRNEALQYWFKGKSYASMI